METIQNERCSKIKIFFFSGAAYNITIEKSNRGKEMQKAIDKAFQITS